MLQATLPGPKITRVRGELTCIGTVDAIVKSACDVDSRGSWDLFFRRGRTMRRPRQRPLNDGRVCSEQQLEMHANGLSSETTQLLLVQQSVMVDPGSSVARIVERNCARTRQRAYSRFLLRGLKLFAIGDGQVLVAFVYHHILSDHFDAEQRPELVMQHLLDVFGRAIEKMRTSLSEAPPAAAGGVAPGSTRSASSVPQASIGGLHELGCLEGQGELLVDDFASIQWKKGELLGAGSFARVYLGMNLTTGKMMAVKQVERGSVLSSNDEISALEKEILLLRELSHPHIVQYYGMERTDNMLSIFLEYVPGGTIATMIKKNGPLGEPTIRSLSRQICDGLSYLHRSHIIHRDIKAANILVDNLGMAKLADFGASKRIADVLRESLGTLRAQWPV